MGATIHKTDIVTTLARVPLLNDLTREELAAVAGNVLLREFRAGEAIFQEGERCTGLWMVESGSVRIQKTSVNGREQLLSEERMGSSLGEVPVFDGGPHVTTAIAEVDAVLLWVRAEDFRTLCEQHPSISLKIIKVLGHKLRHLSSLVEQLSFSTVRGRLAAHLAEIACDRGRKTPRGVEFELTEKNHELAARIGTVRELVSRNLGRLRAEGLIQINGRRRVNIPNIERLKAEALRSE
jgi:CRP/FNR family transcriptional regulator